MSVHKNWCEGQNKPNCSKCGDKTDILLSNLRLTHNNLTSDPNNHHNIQLSDILQHPAPHSIRYALMTVGGKMSREDFYFRSFTNEQHDK